ncbi:MAG: hypothetical protein AB4290_12225 [Spirulina sp.]
MKINLNTKYTSKKKAIRLIIIFIILFFVLGIVLGILIFFTQFSTIASIASVVVTLFCGLFSWQAVTGIIENCMDTAIEEGIRQKNNNIIKLRTQQDLEFMSEIDPDLLCQDRIDLSISREELREYQYKAILRKISIEGLAHETDPDNDKLNLLALFLARKVLRGYDLQGFEITTLRHDLFIYLKAWLMYSILFEREMRAELIRRRYPDPDHPNYQIYIQSFIYLRNSIKEPKILSLLGFEENIQEENVQEKRTMIQKVFENYIDKLIEQLRKMEKLQRDSIRS